MSNNIKTKKIAYILYWNESPHSGVIKKVVSAIKTWEQFGFDCTVFLLTTNSELQSQLVFFYPKIKFKVFTFKNMIQRIKSYWLLTSEVKYLKAQILYFRYHPFFIFLNRIAKKSPLFIEVNTDDIAERKLGSITQYVLNNITRNRIFFKAKGIVTVSNDIATNYSFTKFSKPILVLGNSINLSAIPQLSPTRNKQPELVYIGGSNQPWQGVDKIILMASIFPDWKFNIIGLQKEEFPKSPKNIYFHGFLSTNQYQAIFKKSDCAIGTLALHRKNLNSTSALKVLEYLAYGIPIILSYKETNFPQNYSFLLELPNIENNIAPFKKDIENFVTFWKNKRIDRKLIQSIDTQQIEKKRLDFFSKYSRGFF